MDNSKKINFDFNAQFNWGKQYWLSKTDFIDWYRYLFMIKELMRFKPKTILEIGEGGGVVKQVMKEAVEKYETMDVNEKLEPTYLNDVRNLMPELKSKFDCVIAGDILEHIPFEDLEKALTNLYAYLKPNGRALITIPHRASNFMYMTPLQVPKAIRVPTGFLSMGAFYRRFIKRKIWIDPNHLWEISDGHHKIKDVEVKMKKVGFKMEKLQKLVYVDFWTLKK